MQKQVVSPEIYSRWDNLPYSSYRSVERMCTHIHIREQGWGMTGRWLGWLKDDLDEQLYYERSSGTFSGYVVCTIRRGQTMAGCECMLYIVLLISFWWYPGACDQYSGECDGWVNEGEPDAILTQQLEILNKTLPGSLISMSMKRPAMQ